ncbi:hypothetical protein K432DRAFT_410758 [Lepidopterella palustris CBS 459.81]|uniref:Uncharacterized protein n=1 Tax=Lepidopterella palustris CBS 459.81 TaxID=1314670 RepID=A0A8E2DXB9_9PEZI|nr:hypothetical protein K432DRAFT_410758 [Lepidopterella palustris CBS 459.81]
MPTYIKKEFIKEFNAIIEKYNAVVVGDNIFVAVSNNIPVALVKRCATANKEIRAATKKAAKKGGTSKPKSTQDAVIVLVKEQRKIN